MSPAGDVNPALEQIAFLAGDWTVELSNAGFLGDPKARLETRASFEWVAGGGALMLRQGDKPPSPPAATWIIGRDEAQEGYTVIYNDSRGVSRIYEMRFLNGVWTMWRNHPAFSQRFTGKVSGDRRRIDAEWETSTDGRRSWEHDFDMTYRRA